jgi:hypothetical protein
VTCLALIASHSIVEQKKANVPQLRRCCPLLWLAPAEIDIVIVRHHDSDEEHLVRIAGNAEILRGGRRELLLRANCVDEFEDFLQLRRRERWGVLRCGEVRHHDTPGPN